MTDARLGGLGRETLVAEAGNTRLGGVARETLVSGLTPVLLGSVAREVLLWSLPVVGGQTAVSINTG